MTSMTLASFSDLGVSRSVMMCLVFVQMVIFGEFCEILFYYFFFRGNYNFICDE